MPRRAIRRPAPNARPWGEPAAPLPFVAPRRRRRGAVFAILLALVFAGGFFFDDLRRMADDAGGAEALVALFEPPAGGAPALLRGLTPAEPPDDGGARILRLTAAPGRVAARRFPICGAGARIDCVVDGDTLWVSGQKIRIADINTPEISSPECAAERRLGERATKRLQALVNAGPFELHPGGPDEDRYGRKLRILVRNGRSLGDTLVAEGLAHPWRGRRESWCG